MSALKFFYRVTCPRTWSSLAQVRLPKNRTLPVILSRTQVRQLIASTQRPHFRAFFEVCYACGLRLSDATQLQPGDIDSQRGQVLIRSSKGGKDRIVPIPATTIHTLRSYWRTHRNQALLFPSRVDKRNLRTTQSPMSDRSIQRAFQVVREQQNLAKKGVRLHTLRHSYATHLLDDGVNLKILQQYLGHTSLQTTEIYLHLTQQGDEQARKIIERLMKDDLPPDDDDNDQSTAVPQV